MVKGIDNLTTTKKANLKIGNIYIVYYENEKYRSKFISFRHSRHNKYEVYGSLIFLIYCL